MTLEEFAAKCLWQEHMRLTNFISEWERHKHFVKTKRRIERGDLGIEKNTEWASMVKSWYRKVEGQ